MCVCVDQSRCQDCKWRELEGVEVCAVAQLLCKTETTINFCHLCDHSCLRVEVTNHQLPLSFAIFNARLVAHCRTFHIVSDDVGEHASAQLRAARGAARRAYPRPRPRAAAAAPARSPAAEVRLAARPAAAPLRGPRWRPRRRLRELPRGGRRRPVPPRRPVREREVSAGQEVRLCGHQFVLRFRPDSPRKICFLSPMCFHWTKRMTHWSVKGRV